MAGDRFGQRIVISARQVDTRLARNKIRSWAGDREHLHGDPARIHVGEARVAEVSQFVALDLLAPDDFGPRKTAASDRGRVDAADDAGTV